MNSNKLSSFRIVVAGIIIRTSSVLLLQRHKNEKNFPGLWELPSGKREFGESSIVALEREIQEESGLIVTVGNPVSVFEYAIEKMTEVCDTTQINFLVHLDKPDQKIVVSKEHQRAKWFSKEELESLENVSKETKNSILSILK